MIEAIQILEPGQNHFPVSRCPGYPGSAPGRALLRQNRYELPHTNQFLTPPSEGSLKSI